MSSTHNINAKLFSRILPEIPSERKAHDVSLNSGGESDSFPQPENLPKPQRTFLFTILNSTEREYALVFRETKMEKSLMWRHVLGGQFCQREEIKTKRQFDICRAKIATAELKNVNMQ